MVKDILAFSVRFLLVVPQRKVIRNQFHCKLILTTPLQLNSVRTIIRTNFLSKGKYYIVMCQWSFPPEKKTSYKTGEVKMDFCLSVFWHKPNNDNINKSTIFLSVEIWLILSLIADLIFFFCFHHPLERESVEKLHL